MNNPQELEQIREFFAKDRFATDNGATIEEVDDGYAKCSLEIQPHHLNAANTVMGGAIFTLADFAFAVATFGLLDFTDTFPFPKYAIYDVLEK